MVCSSCGFENQLGMRYCGMCGMPMPHKPITAPGAHSTLNFTRVPVDTRLPASARGPSNGSQAGGGVAVERNSAPATGPQPAAPEARLPGEAGLLAHPCSRCGLGNRWCLRTPLLALRAGELVVPADSLARAAGWGTGGACGLPCSRCALGKRW